MRYLSFGHVHGLVRRDELLLDRFAAQSLVVQSRTIVRYLDVDLTALVKRPQQKQALFLFPRGAAYLWRLNAVIDAVAHEMRQRILDGFDDGLVEFGLLALHRDAHLFATAQRHVAHRPGKLAPNVADGLHAGFHDAFLQLGREQIQPLAGRQQFCVFGGIRILQDLVAQQDELAHAVHQPIELIHVNAHRAVAGALPRLLLDVQCIDHILGFDYSPLHQNLTQVARIPGVLLLHGFVYFTDLRCSSADENVPDIRRRLR